MTTVNQSIDRAADAIAKTMDGLLATLHGSEPGISRAHEARIVSLVGDLGTVLVRMADSLEPLTPLGDGALQASGDEFTIGKWTFHLDHDTDFVTLDIEDPAGRAVVLTEATPDQVYELVSGLAYQAKAVTHHDHNAEECRG